MTPMPPACAMAIAIGGLGDGVHRRRHQRDAELDGAREPRMGVGLVGQHRRGGRLQEDVIESERFLKLHANLRTEKQNRRPWEGRRVGEPLYTLPRDKPSAVDAQPLCTGRFEDAYRLPRKSRFPISTPDWRKIA